jgi:hypothetical protein
MKAVLALSFLIAALPLAAPAQVHKWVDENGITVYSQIPPPNATTSQVVAAPPPPATDPAEARQALDDRIERLDKISQSRDEADTAQRDTRRQADSEAQVAAACSQARAHLEALESGPPRKIIVGPDGEAKRLSYEELQAEIEDTRKFISENCEKN